MSAIKESQLPATLDFDRFCTGNLAFLQENLLRGRLSLPQARVLYQVGTHPGQTITALKKILSMDKGYVSRLTSQLARLRLLRKSVSSKNLKSNLLTLSPAGQEMFCQLQEQFSGIIRGLVTSVSAEDRKELIQPLAPAAHRPKPAIKIVRLREPNDAAFALLEEYYEAVQVMQRDTPDALREKARDPENPHVIWLAFLGGKAVGCVMLRWLRAIPQSGECKRLYVRPEARRLGIAEALLRALEKFARAKGMQWIHLDTHHGLEAALALYRKRKYRACQRYNDNPQATLFLRKQLGSPEDFRRKQRKGRVAGEQQGRS